MTTIIAANKRINLSKDRVSTIGKDMDKSRLYASEAGIRIPTTRINDIHLKIKLRSLGKELPKLIRVYYFESSWRYQSEIIYINSVCGSEEEEIKSNPNESDFFKEAFFVNKIGFCSEGEINSDIEMSLSVEEER